jgi:glutaminase
MDVQGLLDDIHESLRPMIGQGDVADYIPRLAGVHPAHFGMAVVMPDGEAFGTGHWEQPFSIQSISKLFTLAMAYAVDGDLLWQRVSREPSGDPFNSLAQLELQNGIPRNPFINSGAIVVADRCSASAAVPEPGCSTFCGRKAVTMRSRRTRRSRHPRPSTATATRPSRTCSPASVTSPTR